MGNGASAEEKEQMRKENEETIADNERRQNECAAQQKRDLEDQTQRELAEERERIERELREEAERNLAKVDAKIAELAKIKDEQEKELLEWRAQVHEAQNQVNAKLTAEAEAEQEKRRKVQELEVAKLEKEMKELEKARNEKLRIVEEGGERRRNIEKDYNDKTEKQTKEHNEYIVTSNKNLKAYADDKRKELKKLSEQERAHMNALKEREERFKERELNSGNEIMDALKSVGGHDEFRENCNQLRNMFRILKEAYNPIERALTAASSEMRRKKPLTRFPSISNVLNAFETLNAYVEEFHIPEKKIDALKQAIEDIKERMEDYDDAQKKKPENVYKMDKSYESIKNKTDVVKKTLSDLVKEMRKFDIPISNEVTETIVKQAKALNAPGQWKIEYGSSGTKELTD
uniref:F-BAR domain-containing protein n=1 Tax=Caenorhabditis tropicalis TaxID=1561998 RepID=A0A1I7UGG0_9PELO